MATTLTVYWADEDGELVEVEHDGRSKLFEFTNLDDLQIDMHLAKFPKDAIRIAVSDVLLARERELRTYTDDVATAEEPQPYWQAPPYPACVPLPRPEWDFFSVFGCLFGAGLATVLCLWLAKVLEL
jgi:hypothetical protein